MTWSPSRGGSASVTFSAKLHFRSGGVQGERFEGLMARRRGRGKLQLSSLFFAAVECSSPIFDIEISSTSAPSDSQTDPEFPNWCKRRRKIPHRTRSGSFTVSSRAVRSQHLTVSRCKTRPEPTHAEEVHVVGHHCIMLNNQTSLMRNRQTSLMPCRSLDVGAKHSCVQDCWWCHSFGYDRRTRMRMSWDQ